MLPHDQVKRRRLKENTRWLLNARPLQIGTWCSMSGLRLRNPRRMTGSAGSSVAEEGKGYSRISLHLKCVGVEGWQCLLSSSVGSRVREDSLGSQEASSRSGALLHVIWGRSYK